MAPPAKRRKRNNHDTPDDEHDSPKKNSLNNFFLASPESSSTNKSFLPPPSTSPVRKSTRSSAAASVRGNRTAGPENGHPSASTTPEKKSRTTQKEKKTLDQFKSGDLLTMFSKQAQKAQSHGRSNVARTSHEPTFDDIISDPISEDDDVGVHKTVGSSLVGRNAQKRREDNGLSAATPATSSQRFMRASQPAIGSSAAAADDDTRPWSERFRPVNLEELVVHKKKVADVRRWMEDVVKGRLRQRLLVLKGAAGTAKTTTIQLLAKDLGYEILEWRNPTGALGATHGYASASTQFEEFINRGGRFGQLDIHDGRQSPEFSVDNGRPGSPPPNDYRQKIILVEEFPNTFLRSSSALTSFRNTISRYVSSNLPALGVFGQPNNSTAITPVVIIISETLLTTTSASADSFTAHRLLGPEILRHPGTALIEFNAVAPSLLAKALELIVQKEARKSGRRRTPGPQVLKRLGEIGDIRNAISSLEFLCVKGDKDAEWGSKVTFAKTKKGSKDVALTQGERESLELVTQREASLGIFHAVGKVVYNKREESPFTGGSEEAIAETMPRWLAAHSRPNMTQVPMETLMDETGTDTHTFISALYENYALSCEPSSPSDVKSSLDYLNDSLEYLSESDLLCPSRDIFFGGKGAFGGGPDSGSHVVRQDELAFQIAVRGLLFSLPSPVKRSPAGASRGDQFKMFYPAGLKLWRAKEEVEGLLDLWASTMLKGASQPEQAAQTRQSITSGAIAFRRPGSNALPAKPPSGSRHTDSTAAQGSGEDPPPPAAPLCLGSVSRKEMLLERLPFMAQIARRKKASLYSLGPKDLARVVSFQGIGGPSTDEASDGEDDVAPAEETWATDKPTDELSPRKKRTRAIRKDSQGSVAGGLPMSKLVLSDDDIEDD